eukprot:scaffold9198_cov137-Amphora_coffeaeformis.AAC.1
MHLFQYRRLRKQHGLGSTSAVSHRENTMRGVFQGSRGDWLFSLGGAAMYSSSIPNRDAKPQISIFGHCNSRLLGH